MTRTAMRGRGWRAGVSGLLTLGLVAPGAGQAQDAAVPADAPASAAVVTTTTTTTVTTVVQVPAPQESLPAWTLATLPDEPVPFHGLVNMDSAGMGSGGMLYPTGGLGLLGVLVGVAVHAALVGGSRSSQETKMQESADKVLQPYRGVLAGFRVRDLQQRAVALTPSNAVAHLRDVKEAPAGELVVLAQPSFGMTPDASALVLDETVILRPDATSDKGTQQVVRVVSAPRVEEDLVAAWTADNGAALKLAAAAMTAQSLDLALLQTRHPADDKLPFRTVRYALGGTEKMERAQLLAQDCEHMVLRTLRGGLMVVPHRAAAVLPAGCPPLPPVPVRHAPVEAGAASASVAAPLPAASAASATSG